MMWSRYLTIPFFKLSVRKSDQQTATSRGQHALKCGRWTNLVEVFDVLLEVLMEMQESLDVTPCHLVCSRTKWWETFTVPRLKCATQRHICNDCVPSVIHKWTSTERWRNDGGGLKRNYSDKILSLCHVAHLKSHSIPKRHSVDTGRYLLL